MRAGPWPTATRITAGRGADPKPSALNLGYPQWGNPTGYNWGSGDAVREYRRSAFYCPQGALLGRHGRLAERRRRRLSTWVPDFLGVVQEHKLHWTAWSFHPKASPVLLKDWDYEPTSYWGEPARRALNGEAFELNEMR